jgi:hypothetical protein
VSFSSNERAVESESRAIARLVAQLVMSEVNVGNVALELHDSTLESVEHEGHVLIARFSAYVHRSSGAPGVDAGTGWSQSVHFRIGGARVKGSLGSLPMELLGGRLVVSGQVFDNLVRMPLIDSGLVSVQLQGSNSLELVIDGEGIEANLVGPAKYLESFPGANEPNA